jgi:Uma2 family endonuclease
MAGVRAANLRVSYADLERWPEDGRRYELYDGEVFEIPSPIPLHQMVSGRLHLSLEAYVSVHGGIVLYAPLDIVLTEYDVVQPDLLMFTRERQHLINPRKVTRQPPDLAVEILSAGTESNDRGRKLRLLARHGVREYWLVDPEGARIEIYALAGVRFALVHVAGGGDQIRSLLLPDLRLHPNDLLPQLDR